MNWDAEKASWPNAEHSRFVVSGPYRWHVQEAGQGRCVLLLHGAGASTHSWRDVLPALAAGFRVVAIDLPGQGFTTLGPGARSGLADISAGIAKLLADQGIVPDVIVGHSAGAAVALRLALDLDPPPAAVVTINGALGNFPGLAGHVFPQLAKLLSLNPLTGLAFSGLASISPGMVDRLISSTGGALDANGLALYGRLLRDRRHVAGTLAMMAQWNLDRLLEDLPKLRSPVLLLVGGKDRAVAPATSEAAARRIPDARVETFSELGHLLHEERPDLAAAAIRGFRAV